MNEKVRVQILEGCLQEKKNQLYGNYKGFYTTIDMRQAGQYQVRINASSPEDPGNEKLGEYLIQQKMMFSQILDVKAYANVIIVTLKAANWTKLSEAINVPVRIIVDYLISSRYVSGCENCGSQENSIECYEVNGVYHYMCSACMANIETAFAENQQKVQAQKSNFAAGLVGAFLGSLIGCVLWVLIYKLGFIAGIAGAVTIICAMKGYEMFGKHLDKKGVIGSIIIVVVMLYFANKISWAWEAYDALKMYDITFSDAFRGLKEILDASEATTSYYTDLAIGCGLTLVSGFGNIKNAFTKSTGSYSVKKND